MSLERVPFVREVEYIDRSSIIRVKEVNSEGRKKLLVSTVGEVFPLHAREYLDNTRLREWLVGYKEEEF